MTKNMTVIDGELFPVIDYDNMISLWDGLRVITTDPENFVTIETSEGDVYIGTAKFFSPGKGPEELNWIAVTSGYKGRPAMIPMSDIVNILPVTESNPYIES